MCLLIYYTVRRSHVQSSRSNKRNVISIINIHPRHAHILSTMRENPSNLHKHKNISLVLYEWLDTICLTGLIVTFIGLLYVIINYMGLIILMKEMVHCDTRNRVLICFSVILKSLSLTFQRN